MSHWHADPATHRMTLTPGDVDSDGCCNGEATWSDVLGPGATPPARPICPECRDGKHVNCADMALNEATDEIGPCWCETCKTVADDDQVRAEQRRKEWDE